MPRRKFQDGMEVAFQDLDAISAAMEREFYDRVLFELIFRAENVFFGGSFLVSYTGPTSVSVAAGLGFQTDGAAVSPEPTRRPLFRAASATLNLEAPNASNDRIDIVCVRYGEANEITASRKFKDAVSSVISNQNLVVQRDKQAELLVVAGTPAPSPAAPATPAGYIKIAELLVTAVSGMSGSGAITDTRTVAPIGASLQLNTAGFNRLTVGGTVRLSQLLSEIDALLYRGYLNYTDLDEINTPASEPAAPSAGRQRLYYRDGVLWLRNSSGTRTPVGSGSGGGGGGGAWNPVDGLAPVESFENNEKVWLFQAGLTQSLCLFVKVPQGYIAGRQIQMFIGQYSPSSSNTQLLQAMTYLIRRNNDAVTSVANSHASANAALTNTVANQYREATLNLTSSVGTINSLAVQAGDLLRVELTRGTDTDTEDVRFIPSATEIKFG